MSPPRSMSRTAWAALGGLSLGLLILFLAVLLWLPGPRASLPSAPASTPLGSSLPTPETTRSPAGLPNPRLTPGSINPDANQDNLATTVCLSGWTKKIRPPSAYTSALKLVQIIEYGYTDRSPEHYQEDHLVPLELGGAPRDPRNLWPQPNDSRLSDGTPVGSAAKDGLEDYLHGAVCAGAMSLDDAQRLIAGDWVAAWNSAGRP